MRDEAEPDVTVRWVGSDGENWDPATAAPEHGREVVIRHRGARARAAVRALPRR